jgi:hypothetical protein
MALALLLLFFVERPSAYTLSGVHQDRRPTFALQRSAKQADTRRAVHFRTRGT